MKNFFGWLLLVKAQLSSSPSIIFTYSKKNIDTPPAAPQEPGVAQPLPPGKQAPGAYHLADAPGFLGAAETAGLETPPPAGTDLFGVAPQPSPASKLEPTAKSASAGSKTRPPTANGRPVSMPRDLSLHPHINSTTILF
jgi:hypothetical protein